MKSLGLMIIISIAAIGCAPQHSNNGGIATLQSTEAASAASLQAFQSTVYQFGNTYGCVKCHGGAVNPQWMNADLTVAYSFARPLLDVNNPKNSPYATYVANNHCNDPVCTVAANIPTMQSYLLQWAAVEVNQSTNGLVSNSGTTLANPAYVTAAMPIPNPLPIITDSTVDVIRFDLTQLSPQVPALVGAVLEVSIQAYNAVPTTYKVFDPRIVGNSASVTVSGIHVYIRPAADTGLGTEDTNQGTLWSNLTAIASPSLLPSPLPPGPMMNFPILSAESLGIAVQSGADVMTIGFASIQ